MTTTINAQATNGLITTADGSGIVKLQSNGVTTNSLCWIRWQYDTGSIVTKSSYNVSSLTRVSGGIWQVAFSTSTSDGNYAFTGMTTNNSLGGTWGMVMCPDVTYTHSTTACRVATVGGGNATLYDAFINSVVLFGN